MRYCIFLLVTYLRWTFNGTRWEHAARSCKTDRLRYIALPTIYTQPFFTIYPESRQKRRQLRS